MVKVTFGRRYYGKWCTPSWLLQFIMTETKSRHAVKEAVVAAVNLVAWLLSFCHVSPRKQPYLPFAVVQSAV